MMQCCQPFRVFKSNIPKTPVTHHSWETKKVLKFWLNKTASVAIFKAIYSGNMEFAIDGMNVI